jgi:sugar lactone lactonase YvrE
MAFDGAWHIDLMHPDNTAGNVYATDTINNRVLKFPANGGPPTVVNIPAISPSPSTLNGPTGIAMDGAGNLFIADTGNNRIVEVTAAGSSQVVVACLTPASSLPPLCATDSDYSFNSPKSLFIDAGGNLIVDDAGNNKIVQLTTNYALSNDNTLGFVNAFVLSTGTFVFGANSSVAVDSAEGLYISDDTNSRIIKVDRLGSSSLVDFSSLSTGLSTPHSVTLDPMDNLYVMDAGGTSGAQRVVQKFTNGTVSTLAFNGATFGATANQLAVDNSGNVLVTDTSNSKLLEVNVV